MPTIGFFAARWIQRPKVKVQVLEAIVIPAHNTYRRPKEKTAYIVTDFHLKIQFDNSGSKTALREICACFRDKDSKFIELDPDCVDKDSPCGLIWRPTDPFSPEEKSSQVSQFKLDSGFSVAITKAKSVRLAFGFVGHRTVVIEVPVVGGDMKPLA